MRRHQRSAVVETSRLSDIQPFSRVTQLTMHVHHADAPVQLIALLPPFLQWKAGRRERPQLCPPPVTESPWLHPSSCLSAPLFSPTTPHPSEE